MKMDELDLLLEEIALNPTGPGSAAKSTHPSDDFVGLDTKRGAGSQFSKVYRPSEQPDAVPASPTLSSVTSELDSILQDLVGRLEDETSELPTTPPPIAAKKSAEKKTEGGTQQKEQTDATATSSDIKTPTSKKSVDVIDDLLGGLSSELEKIGVRTTTKGHCASCDKPIVGKMITTLGQVWHPEHFVCAVCKTELGTRGFFERDGVPYCQEDYQKLFSPRCAYCTGPILQNILTAMDLTWHPEHFFCAHCGDQFGSEGFMPKDGKPYCSRDFYQLFAPKCSGCGEPVRENYLTAANGTWHPECFVCSDCLMPFTDGGFLELDGRPLCALHYHTRQGTLCGGCEKPISGRCISAMGSKFHPEHFVCAFCLRQLSQGVFKEQGGKPYCQQCHTKLFLG